MRFMSQSIAEHCWLQKIFRLCSELYVREKCVFNLIPPSRVVCRFRRYVSSHGASIQKTKLFLERESSRLVERQAALREAQTSSSQFPNQEGGLTEEMLGNLQQVREGCDPSPAKQ